MKAQGLLLLILGVWLLLQTMAGDLPGRILSLRNVRPGSTTKVTGA